MKKSVPKYTPKEIIKKVAGLKSARGTWETHWQDVTDYVLPRKDNVLTQRTPGEKKAFRLLDNTAMMANEMLAGALHGMLTNPDLQWFEFTTGIPELDNKDEVRMWLQLSSRALHNILNNTNFQTEVHELYIDLPSIGTGCMLMEEHPTDVIRFRTRFIRDYFICENHLGLVDELYYVYKASAKDIVVEFGIDKVPKEVAKAYEKEDHKQFNCIHAVYPKTNKDPKYKGDQKYVSQYIIKDLEFELEEGFFMEFPYVVPRWSKAAGEAYGRGPGMNALPEMKVLNKMNETMLIGAQKMVDPPIQMPDDGYIMPIVTTPGGINYYRSGTQEIIKPIFNNTQLEFGYQAMADRQKRVRDCFYIDHLRLQQGGPMMTATEVMQRTEEAMRLLGPMLGRQQVEFLRPLIMRTYSIASRRNLLPAPPEELMGKKFDVKYSSLIAKAQKVNEAQSIMRAFSAAAPFIQLNPTAADNFNADQAVRTIVGTYGAPQEILHTQKNVAKIREGKEQAQQAAQQAQQERLDTVNVLDTAKAAKALQGV